MARLKENRDSWHARSIMRRDARHDNEAVADLPSTGHKRAPVRKHVKRCNHDYQHVYSGTYYIHERCTNCGKGKYSWGGARRWRRWRHYPSRPRPLPNPHDLHPDFFPFHEPGVCRVCDDYRTRAA